MNHNSSNCPTCWEMRQWFMNEQLEAWEDYAKNGSYDGPGFFLTLERLDKQPEPENERSHPANPRK